MINKTLKVNLSPQKVMNVIKNNMDAYLTHEETHQVDESKFVGAMIYKKHVFRSKDSVALIFLINNLEDNTNVKIISTSPSVTGGFVKYETGKNEDFIDNVINIIEEMKENILTVKNGF